jgi:hypothetical protein
MLNRLKAAWAALCRPKGDIFDRIAEVQATETPNLEPFTPEATLTPAECRACFEFIRELFVAWTVQANPDFDLYQVKAADVELYWRVIDFDIQVQKINRPVRAEAFRWFMTEYAKSMNDALVVSRSATSGDVK